jgi:hypothetical protein
MFDICTSIFNRNSVQHDSDTARPQAFRKNTILSSLAYVIEIAGLNADQNEAAATFNTTDELIAKKEPHNLRLLCLLNTRSSMHKQERSKQYVFFIDIKRMLIVVHQRCILPDCI